ncbi:hypothetical protein EON81_16860 [bacterium]|nr:MAG: hypothetical protein EON81_16860 [bacterium]
MTRLRLLAYIGAASLLVCGAGGYVALRWSGGPERAALKVQLARAERLGLSTKMESLWPPANDPAANAAPIYTSLSGSRRLLHPVTEELRKIGYPHSSKDAAAIDAALASVSSELVSIKEAAAMPECRFTRVASYDVLLPEYNPMRHGTWLLEASARRRSFAGDPIGAMQDLTIAARIGAQMGIEPMLAIKGVQTKTESEIFQTAQEVLGKYGTRPEVRKEARRMFAALGSPPDFKAGTGGEWAWRWAVVRAYEDGKMGLVDILRMAGFPSAKARFSKERTAFGIAMASPAGRARLTEAMAKVFLDYYEALPSDPAKVEQAREARKAMDKAIASDPTKMVLAQIHIPFGADSADLGGEAVARRRLFLGLLNALDTPTPPASLPLKGSEAIDPFSGKPFRYRANPEEIRIWSVGPNVKDDMVAMWPRPGSTGDAR